MKGQINIKTKLNYALASCNSVGVTIVMASPPTHQRQSESTTYLLIKLCHPLFIDSHEILIFLGGILFFLYWYFFWVEYWYALEVYKTKTDNIIIITFKCEISIKLPPSVYDFLAHRINIYNVCIGIFFWSCFIVYTIYSSNKTWAADCFGTIGSNYLSSICAYLSPRGSGLVGCCVSILKYFLLISFQLKRYFNYLLYGNWRGHLNAI